MGTNRRRVLASSSEGHVAKRYRAIVRRKWESSYISLRSYERCLYCGSPEALTTDHIPSPLWLERLGLEWFLSRKLTLLLVDACAKCNSNLRAYPLFTVRERRACALSKTYRATVRKLCHGPWRKGLSEFYA